jgi:hypothetical protein
LTVRDSPTELPVRNAWQPVALLAAKAALLAFLVACALWLANAAFYRRHFKVRDMAREIAVTADRIDLLIVGTSHGIAVRDLNLGASNVVLNISDSDLGLYPAMIKCDYVRERRAVETILFVIDPFQLAGRRNEFAQTFDFFVFDRRLYRLMKRYGLERISLLRHRYGMIGNLPKVLYWSVAGTHVVFDPVAAVRQPPSTGRFSDWADRRGKAEVRIRHLYAGTDPDATSTYLSLFEDFIGRVRGEGTDVVLVLPPYPRVSLSLLPPEHASIREALRMSAERSGARFVDLTAALPDEALYADADHLNGSGLARFAPLVIPYLE